MKICIAIIASLSCATLMGQEAISVDKQKRDVVCLGILHRVATGETYTSVALEGEIGVLDIASLGRLATLARTLYYPGDASTKDYDKRWEQLFWKALELIAEKSEGSESVAIETLTIVQDSLLMDANNTVRFRGIIERIESNKRSD